MSKIQSLVSKSRQSLNHDFCKIKNQIIYFQPIMTQIIHSYTKGEKIWTKKEGLEKRKIKINPVGQTPVIHFHVRHPINLNEVIYIKIICKLHRCYCFFNLLPCHSVCETFFSRYPVILVSPVSWVLIGNLSFMCLPPYIGIPRLPSMFNVFYDSLNLVSFMTSKLSHVS